MEYAGFWRRFVAYIIDTIIMYLVTIPIFLIFGAGGALTMSPDTNVWGQASGSLTS